MRTSGHRSPTTICPQAPGVLSRERPAVTAKGDCGAAHPGLTSAYNVGHTPPPRGGPGHRWPLPTTARGGGSQTCGGPGSRDSEGHDGPAGLPPLTGARASLAGVPGAARHCTASSAMCAQTGPEARSPYIPCGDRSPWSINADMGSTEKVQKKMVDVRESSSCHPPKSSG